MCGPHNLSSWKNKGCDICQSSTSKNRLMKSAFATSLRGTHWISNEILYARQIWKILKAKHCKSYLILPTSTIFAAARLSVNVFTRESSWILSFQNPTSLIQYWCNVNNVSQSGAAATDMEQCLVMNLLTFPLNNRSGRNYFACERCQLSCRQDVVIVRDVLDMIKNFVQPTLRNRYCTIKRIPTET